MRNDWSVVLIVCAALGAAPAWAGSTADDLARIEAQNAVLKARLRVLETRAQMAARQADIERHAPALDRSTPTVGSIEGMNDKLRATVLLDGSRRVEVVAGDVLPNGMRVVSIRPDGVVVRGADRKRVRLNPAAHAGGSDPAFTFSAEASAPRAERPPVMPPMPARPGASR